MMTVTSSVYPSVKVMSKLDEAMEVQMASIVLTQHKPFCYRDFLHFRLDGTDYAMSHGTFRNKISRLMKKNEVEIVYRSFQTFYTLRGQKFGKPMTPYHAVVHNHPFYKFLQDLPLDEQSIHDIRLKFQVKGLWSRLSVNTAFHLRPVSEDIVIPAWNIDNIIVKVSVHRTDSISLVLACSIWPIPLDVEGIMYFITLLARVEERLRITFEGSSACKDMGQSVPDYKKWTITMWHFGRDSLTRYEGEKFCITVEKVQAILVRAYVKNIKGKNKIRFERQEYPSKQVADIIEERLDEIVRTVA